MAKKESAAKVGQVEATFRDVALPFGLTVDLIRLTASKAAIKRDPFQIDLAKPGNLVVTVSEQNLQAFLEKQSPGGLRDFDVKLHEGKVFVEATAQLIVGLRAKAICTLRIVDATQLWVDLKDVEVFGVAAKSLVEKQLEKINPVLDAAEFPFDVKLEKVTIVDGELVLQGTASPRS